MYHLVACTIAPIKKSLTEMIRQVVDDQRLLITKKRGVVAIRLNETIFCIHIDSFIKGKHNIAKRKIMKQKKGYKE